MSQKSVEEINAELMQWHQESLRSAGLVEEEQPVIDPRSAALLRQGAQVSPGVTQAKILETAGQTLATAIDPERTEEELRSAFQDPRLPGTAYRPAPRMRIDPFAGDIESPMRPDGTITGNIKAALAHGRAAVSRQKFGAPREEDIEKLVQQQEEGYTGVSHPGLLALNQLIRDPVYTDDSGRVVESTGRYLFRQLAGPAAALQQNLVDLLTVTTVQDPETGLDVQLYDDDFGIFNRRIDPNMPHAVVDTGSMGANMFEAWRKMQMASDVVFQMPDLKDNLPEPALYGLSFALDLATPISGHAKLLKTTGKAGYKLLNEAGQSALRSMGYGPAAEALAKFEDPVSGIVDYAAFKNVNSALGLSDDFDDFVRADVNLAQRASQQISDRFTNPLTRGQAVQRLQSNKATEYLATKLEGAEQTLLNAGLRAADGKPLTENAFGLVSSLARFATQTRTTAGDALLDAVELGVSGGMAQRANINKAATDYFNELNVIQNKAFQRFFYTDVLRPSIAREVAELTGGHYWRFANQSTLIKASEYDKVMPKIDEEVDALLANDMVADGVYLLKNGAQAATRLIDEVGATRVVDSKILSDISDRLLRGDTLDMQQLLILREKMIDNVIRTSPSVKAAGMRAETLSQDAFQAASLPPERRMRFLPGSQGFEQFTKAIQPAIRYFSSGAAPSSAQSLPVARDVNVKFTRWLENYQSMIADTEKIYRQQLRATHSNPAEAVRLVTQRGLQIGGKEEYVRLMETLYSGTFSNSLRKPTLEAVEALDLDNLVISGNFQLADITRLADEVLKYVGPEEAALLAKARKNLFATLADLDDTITKGAVSRVAGAVRTKVLRRTEDFKTENARLSYVANAYAMSKIQADMQAKAVEELLDMSPDLAFRSGAVQGERMFRNVVQTLFNNPSMVSSMNSTEYFAGEVVQKMLEGTRKGLAERAAQSKMTELNKQLSAELRVMREDNANLVEQLRVKRDAARLLKYAQKQIVKAEEKTQKAAITRDEIDILARLLKEKEQGVDAAKAKMDSQLEKVKDMLTKQEEDIQRELKNVEDPALARLADIKEEIPGIKIKERVAQDRQADLDEINARFEAVQESLLQSKIITGTRRQKAELEIREDFAADLGKKAANNAKKLKEAGLKEMNKVHDQYMNLRTANNALLEDSITSATTQYKNAKELRSQAIADKFKSLDDMDDPNSMRNLLEDVQDLLQKQHDDGLEFLATVDALRRETRNHNQSCYRLMVKSQLKVKNKTLASLDQMMTAGAAQSAKVYQDAITNLGVTGTDAVNALKSERALLGELLKASKAKAAADKKNAANLAKQFQQAIKAEGKESKKQIKELERTQRLNARQRAKAQRAAAQQLRQKRLKEADEAYANTLQPLKDKLAQARADYKARAATRLQVPPTITQAEMDRYAYEYLNNNLGQDFFDVVAYLTKNGIIPRTNTVRAEVMPAIEAMNDVVTAGRSSLLVFGDPKQAEAVQKFMDADYLRQLENQFAEYKFTRERDISGFFASMWQGAKDASTTLRRIRIGGILGGPTVFTPNVDFFGLNAMGAPLITAVAAPGYFNTVVRAQAAGFVSILPKGISLSGMRKIFQQPLSETLLDVSRAVPGARLGTRSTRTIAGAAAGGLVGGLPGAMLGGSIGALSANWAKTGANIGKMRMSPTDLNKLADAEDFASFYTLEWETGFLRDAANYTALDKYLKPMGGAERLLKNFFSGMSGSKNYWAYATQTYDEAFRKAVFIEALTQGRPMHEARILARNVLLDYSAMPEWLRQTIFKQSVFSSFFYGMFSEVLKSPFMGKGEGFANIARMVRLKEASRDPMQQELLYPEYNDPRMFTFVNTTFGGKTLSLSGPPSPPLEIVSLLGRVHDMAVSGNQVGVLEEAAMRFTGFGTQFLAQSYTDALLYSTDYVQAGYVPANYILSLQALDLATGRPVGKQFLDLFGCEPVDLSKQLERAEEPTYAGSSWRFPDRSRRNAFVAFTELYSLIGYERGFTNLTGYVARKFGSPEELGKQGFVPAELNAIRALSVMEGESAAQVNMRANEQIYKDIRSIRRKGQLPE